MLTLRRAIRYFSQGRTRDVEEFLKRRYCLIDSILFTNQHIEDENRKSFSPSGPSRIKIKAISKEDSNPSSSLITDAAIASEISVSAIVYSEMLAEAVDLLKFSFSAIEASAKRSRSVSSRRA